MKQQLLLLVQYITREGWGEESSDCKRIMLVALSHICRYLVPNKEGYLGVKVTQILFLPEVLLTLLTDLVLQLLNFLLCYKGRGRAGERERGGEGERVRGREGEREREGVRERGREGERE